MVYWKTQERGSRAAYGLSPGTDEPCGMNQFVGLPWRIAALAGLVVGAISLATGAGFGTCLLRVGTAFAVFAAAGYGLSLLLQVGSPPAPGRHFDQRLDPADPQMPEEGAEEPPGA